MRFTLLLFRMVYRSKNAKKMRKTQMGQKNAKKATGFQAVQEALWVFLQAVIVVDVE